MKRRTKQWTNAATHVEIENFMGWSRVTIKQQGLQKLRKVMNNSPQHFQNDYFDLQNCKKVEGKTFVKDQWSDRWTDRPTDLASDALDKQQLLC